MNQGRKKAESELLEMASKSGNKVVIGMCHYLYGPLRGLNFMLENVDKKKVNEILDFIDLSRKEIPEKKAFKMIDDSKSGKLKVTNIHELIVQIWCETGMSPSPSVIGSEIDLNAFENPPEVAKDLNDGIRIILKSLKMTAPLQKKDPFFFRVGIL